MLKLSEYIIKNHNRIILNWYAHISIRECFKWSIPAYVDSIINHIQSEASDICGTIDYDISLDEYGKQLKKILNKHN